jgi:hypothetical protein
MILLLNHLKVVSNLTRFINRIKQNRIPKELSNNNQLLSTKSTPTFKHYSTFIRAFGEILNSETSKEPLIFVELSQKLHHSIIQTLIEA